MWLSDLNGYKAILKTIDNSTFYNRISKEGSRNKPDIVPMCSEYVVRTFTREETVF